MLLDPSRPGGPPAGVAPEAQRALGPHLGDIRSGRWLPAPAGTIVAGYRRDTTGAESRWYLQRDDDGFRIEVTRPLTATADVLPWGGERLVEVEGLREHLTLSSRVLTQVQAEPALLPEVFRCLHLHPDAEAGAYDWDGQDGIRQRLLEEDLASLVGVSGVSWTVNGTPVTAVRLPWGGTAPFAPDQSGEAGTLGSVVAEHWWHSESGVGPVSWDGSGRLTDYGTHLVRRADGDREQALDLLPRPESEIRLGEDVAAWVLDCDVEFLEGVALERDRFLPLLPKHRRGLWEEMAEELEAAAAFPGLSEEGEATLCQMLLRDSPICRALHSLAADPRAPLAYRLEQALEQCLQDGVLLRLTDGEWLQEQSGSADLPPGRADDELPITFVVEFTGDENTVIVRLRQAPAATDVVELQIGGSGRWRRLPDVAAAADLLGHEIGDLQSAITVVGRPDWLLDAVAPHDEVIVDGTLASSQLGYWLPVDLDEARDGAVAEHSYDMGTSSGSPGIDSSGFGILIRLGDGPYHAYGFSDPGGWENILEFPDDEAAYAWFEAATTQAEPDPDTQSSTTRGPGFGTGSASAS